MVVLGGPLAKPGTHSLCFVGKWMAKLVTIPTRPRRIRPLPHPLSGVPRAVHTSRAHVSAAGLRVKPGPPLSAHMAAHQKRPCNEPQQTFRVAMSRVFMCEGRQVESELSDYIDRYFVDNTYCYKHPIFDKAAGADLTGTLTYRWYVYDGATPYFMSEGHDFILDTRTVDTTTPYPSLPKCGGMTLGPGRPHPLCSDVSPCDSGMTTAAVAAEGLRLLGGRAQTLH